MLIVESAYPIMPLDDNVQEVGDPPNMAVDLVFAYGNIIAS